MPQTATTGKKVAEGLQNEADVIGIRGAGHHNLLFIRDYATGEKTFRAETEIRLNDKNRAAFSRLEELLKNKPQSAADTKEIVGILHREVDAMPDGPLGVEGKKRAKAIFSAAFGLIS